MLTMPQEAPMKCGSCGTELRQTAKFCDECGTPTTPVDEAAEYKQVTVLFADVVRSMDIAAAVDPERLRDIMSELLRRSSEVVRRYGGVVDKFTGDGVMALFGAPVALEDHAVRACLAALDVQQEAVSLAEEVKRRDALALQLRVGLNSGRVIAGAVGAGPWSYTALGEQVGMAQRMESAAPAGGVMLSESTARLVEHCATLAEPQLVRIKGREHPVAARQLVGIGSRTIDRTEGRLVGRHWEMAALDSMVQRDPGARRCGASDRAGRNRQGPSNDFTVGFARFTRGLALIHHDGTASGEGFKLLAGVRKSAAQERLSLTVLPAIDTYIARAKALDGAIELSRKVVNGLHTNGGLVYTGIAVEALGEFLLRRGEPEDLVEVGSVIERLAAVPTDAGFVLHELPLLRLRALLARARHDESGYRKYANDYGALANSIGFEACSAHAGAMS
jgi:class 3 adenylate cyclase